MAAELNAFSDLFDVAHTLAEEIRSLHPNRKVPVRLFTDSKSLFDVISKGSRTSEKRLMLDIAAAREGFIAHEISDIGFIRTDENFADGLPKPQKQAGLRSLIETGRLQMRVEQWIVRASPSRSSSLE